MLIDIARLRQSLRGDAARRVTALVALLFLLRALIPAGYMPAAQAGAVLGLTLCDGHAHHAAGGDSPAGGKAPVEGPCAFAAGFTVTPPALAALAPSPDFAPLRIPLPARVVSASVTTLRTQTARAPPVHA